MRKTRRLRVDGAESCLQKGRQFEFLAQSLQLGERPFDRRPRRDVGREEGLVAPRVEEAADARLHVDDVELEAVARGVRGG